MCVKRSASTERKVHRKLQRAHAREQSKDKKLKVHTQSRGYTFQLWPGYTVNPRVSGASSLFTGDLAYGIWMGAQGERPSTSWTFVDNFEIEANGGVKSSDVTTGKIVAAGGGGNRVKK